MIEKLKAIKIINKSKISILAILMLFGLSGFFAVTIAQNGSRGDRGSDPLVIFETMVDDANSDGYAIQETALDGISDQEGEYEKAYKVSNTLDYVRKNIDPYLQWMIYAGLVLATIGLIYSGFLIVTNAIHKQGERATVKTNVMHILLGVFLLSGFYFIIKMIVALITAVFGGANGGTGY